MEKRIVELKQALQAARDNTDRAAEARLLNELGALTTRPGGGQDALRHLSRAQELATELADDSLRAQVLSNMGRAFMADGLVREALQHYQSALALAQSIREPRIELAALRALTYANRQFVSADRALDFARASVALADSLSDTDTQGELLLVAANLLGDMDMFEEALAGFRQAIDIFDASGRPLQKAQALGNLAMTHARLQQVEPAADHFRRARTEFQQLGKAADMVQADTYLQAIEAGQIDQFVPGPLLNLRKARESGVPERILNALDDIMASHVDQSHMRSVIMYAHQKIAVARQVSDSASESDAFADLGTAHLALGEAEEAAEAQQQALRLAQAQGNTLSHLNSLLGLFDAQQQIDKQDAIKTGHAAIDLAVARGDTEVAMQVAGVLGVLYEDLGDAQNAATQLRHAVERAERIGETARQATYQFNLGMLLFESKSGGVEELRAARSLFLQLDQPQLVEHINRILGGVD